MAVFGESFKNGIELALHDLHKILGEKTPVVIYEDDQGNANQAVSAFRKLIAVDHVECVIGGVMSSTAAPIAPIAQEKQVVLLSPAATAPDLSRFKTSSSEFSRQTPLRARSWRNSHRNDYMPRV